jgi:hypothetical protein
MLAVDLHDQPRLNASEVSNEPIDRVCRRNFSPPSLRSLSRHQSDFSALTGCERIERAAERRKGVTLW